MLTDQPITRVHKSIVRHVSDLIEEINSDTGYGLLYHVWESRGEEDKLPQMTLLGVDAFNFHENGGLWIISVSISLSSYQDIALSKELHILDYIKDRFGEQKTVPLRNLVSGEEETLLVSTGFEISPMAQTLLRNYRTVSVELRLTSNEGG
jgi:hypothetical protein